MKRSLGIAVSFFLAVQPVFAQSLKSTLEDQKSVEVTVYNSNIGLVKDVRQIQLPAGEGELKFMDVAAFINPVTVLIRSLNQPQALSVLEQNYEYDLLSPQKLMDKYVGKKIKLLNVNQYQNTKETVEAELMSNNNGEVFKIGNEIYLGHPGYRILPEIPDNLIAKPTLTWMFRNSGRNLHEVELSYLTSNITWKADYVLLVNEDDTRADLSGWVTIDNKSGATYKDAKLKLVAGEVNRVYEESGLRSSVAYGAYAAKVVDGAAGFVEKSFFEYHIYDLQRKTTVKDNQTKQISLLEAGDVNVRKEFLVRGNKGWWFSSYAGQDLKTPVEVFLKFKNSKENNMGMPLPKGTMRLYKKDSDGSQQFIGEDSIEHTPKDEEVRLKIGEAFDLVAERKQMDFQVLASGHLYESEWEITLKNHKEGDCVIGLLEPMSSDWQVVTSSHPYVKVDAFTARFDVNVPKDAEVKVKYRVRVRY